MYLNRKTSYLISIFIVLIFLLMGVLFLNTNYQQPPPQLTTPQIVPPPSPQELAPEEPEHIQTTSSAASPVSGKEGESTAEGFALETFHRSETRDGKTLWEVLGSNARYFPEENRVDIEACLFFTTDEKGQKILLKASQATLILKGPELQFVRFPNDVRLDYGSDMKIITSAADYDHREGEVTTSAHVQVVGDWFIVEGDGLKARLDSEQYEIQRNVTSILEPQKRK
jgi:LPS export ABC transporter protein LptC